MYPLLSSRLDSLSHPLRPSLPVSPPLRPPIGPDQFYESCVEDIANDSIAKFKGKKGEGPMNEAAEKMMPEIKRKEEEKEKKKREKESEEEGEGGEGKKQKKD